MTKSSNDIATNGESNTVWGTTSFVPGNDVGLVSRHTIGLVERNNPSTRERLWSLVAVDAPLDDILDELSSTGLKSLPDFGIAQVDGDSVRVVARGRTLVTAVLASGETHVVDATTVRTWIEEALSDVVSVTIELEAAEADVAIEIGAGDTFAVLAGSVPAASLTRRYDEPDPHAVAAESWPVSSVAVEPESIGDAAAGTEPVETALGETDLVETDLEFSTGDASADEMEVVAADAEPPSDPQPPAPLIDVADESAAADIAPPAGPPLSNPPSSPAAPAFGGRVSTPDSTVIVQPEVGDDGATRSPAFAPFDAEADLAHTLSDGASDEPFADDEPAAAVLGVLVFSDGTRLDVDRAVLIGRNPKVVGAVDGPLPHIMKYEGPGQGLSRTHAEIRVEDGEMVLEDLESTNGTEVELPGEPRRRVHGGDPIVIVPGTLIDFGDELHCTVESAW
jgi:hypothetical protein